MNKTKITIAIDIRLVGKKRTGDEAVFFHLTKELLKLDSQNRYILLTDETESAKIAFLYAHLECVGQTNVEIISLSSKNRFLWNLFAVPKFLFQNSIDIFYTQYILPVCLPKRTKVITHIHDVSFRAYPELIRRSDRFFLALLIPFSLKRATRIITPSQFTKNEIVHYYNIPAEKIMVIPNGIGDDFLETISNDADPRLLRNKYALPERYIVSVGTLQPRKNIPFLIEAFALLKKRLPQMKLVLVGNKTAYHTDPHIEKSIESHHFEREVLFPGFVEQKDLPTVIRHADAFVFPSLYEGFGIPLLEAMSQEVPIAASSLPSLKEVAGEAALYFDPASIAQCEEILYTLCTQEETKETLRRAGKERMKHFSWKMSAVYLFDALNKIASGLK